MPDVGPHPYAPGALEFVRAFVNTRDIEAGTDRLETLDGVTMTDLQAIFAPGRCACSRTSVFTRKKS